MTYSPQSGKQRDLLMAAAENGCSADAGVVALSLNPLIRKSTMLNNDSCKLLMFLPVLTQTAQWKEVVKQYI